MNKKYIMMAVLLGMTRLLYAQSTIESLGIALDSVSQPMRYYLDKIEQRYPISIYYDNSKVSLSQPIRSEEKNITIKALFELGFESQSVDILFKERSILIQPKMRGSSSKKVTIKGFISDAANGEMLIGAVMGDVSTGKGVMTNTYGFYSLTLPQGEVFLRTSYVGFEKKKLTFDLQRDTTINLSLRSDQLDEVVINANNYDEEIGFKSTRMGTHQMSGAQLKYRSVFVGEPDVLKSLQMLPGVSMVDESSSKLLVRGGDADQNLILLDGVPVYNAAHLFSFFSVFNPDAINSVSMIKGAFPARYGGRLSSVVDISMKEGNNKEFHGGGAIGLISSKLTLEGPILNKKGSFLLTGRRSYFDVFKSFYNSNKSYVDHEGNNVSVKNTGSYYFYDFSGKVNYDFSERDRLFLSFYGGKDYGWNDQDKHVSNEERSSSTFNENEIGWKNNIALLRWNHVWNNQLFSNIGVSYSHYSFGAEYQNHKITTQNNETDDSFNELNVESQILDWSAKVDFDYFPSQRHHVRFGGVATRHWFNPNALSSKEDDQILKNVSNELYSHEYGLYVEDDFEVLDFLSVNLGVHGSAYAVMDQWYYSAQPRLSLTTLLSQRMSIKASYSQMQQYIHLLTHPSVGLPTDFWVPVTDQIKPQESQQVSLGYYYNHAERVLEISVEGYYKEMKNMIAYKDGQSFAGTSLSWDQKVTVGSGTGYGAEFYVKKKYKKTEGWIGYTLSWANRTYPELNFGEPFPYKYDRRHQINIALNHQVNQKIYLSCNWTYASGHNTTLPYGVYRDMERDLYHQNYFLGNDFTSSKTYVYFERNSFKTRAFHRLDISARFNKKKKWGERNWVISLYNAYNRKNTFYATVDDTWTGNEYKKVIVEKSFFPVIPSISYEFVF